MAKKKKRFGTVIPKEFICYFLCEILDLGGSLFDNINSDKDDLNYINDLLLVVLNDQLGKIRLEQDFKGSILSTSRCIDSNTDYNLTESSGTLNDEKVVVSKRIWSYDTECNKLIYKACYLLFTNRNSTKSYVNKLKCTILNKSGFDFTNFNLFGSDATLSDKQLVDCLSVLDKKESDKTDKYAEYSIIFTICRFIFMSTTQSDLCGKKPMLNTSNIESTICQKFCDSVVWQTISSSKNLLGKRHHPINANKVLRRDTGLLGMIQADSVFQFDDINLKDALIDTKAYGRNLISPKEFVYKYKENYRQMYEYINEYPFFCKDHSSKTYRKIVSVNDVNGFIVHFKHNASKLDLSKSAEYFNMRNVNNIMFFIINIKDGMKNSEVRDQIVNFTKKYILCETE